MHPKQKKVRNLRKLIPLGLFLLLVLGAGFLLYTKTKTLGSVVYISEKKEEEVKPVAKHLPVPVPLKAIYMSQCVVGTPTFRESLVKFIDETDLNAVVIDIKDYTGSISFPTIDPMFAAASLKACGARDMKEFLATLHDKGIYIIGRITVFQSPLQIKEHPEWAVRKKSDPEVAWKDYKGLSFIDAGAKPYWDYVVTLSKESYEIGFDELNYDYVRYPSDGPMSEVNPIWSKGVSKEAMLEEFFGYLSERVRPMGAVMSADLFGMTTTNFDDLNIGQVMERALPHFDYIYPMVYPSHYPKSFLGLGNPNNDPYKVVNYSMTEAVKRLLATSTRIAVIGYPMIASSSPAMYEKPVFDRNKLRPWLQDFDYGKDYTLEDIRAQIKASEDAGLHSWLFWDPANKYLSLKQFLSEQTTIPEER
ncbi:MAG: putative glycoside hydrolase [Patescibacteria group bacterium]